MLRLMRSLGQADTRDSICKEYWQVVLAQGITCGIGFGCLFLPGIAIVPQYFVKKRAFAGGLAAAGSGFGRCTLLKFVRTG